MKLSATLDELPDEDLLGLCEERDRNAYAALVRRYQSLVCSVAFGIVGDIGQSEDLAQDAFLTAWKDLAKLRDRSKFRAWLCGITRNLANGSVRKSIRVREVQSQGEEPAGPLTPGESAVSREEQELVWSALEKLPETYREPLILFYREEQSVSQVARQLDLSENAVKQRLSRGRAMLREGLTGMIEGVLSTTRPGPLFTAAVLGALPGVLATSAAASATATGATGKMAAGSVAGTALSGAIMGALGGLLGALFGYWMGHQTARYAEQRVVLRRWSFLLIGMVVVFSLFALVGPARGKEGVGNPHFWIIWSISFGVSIAAISWYVGHRIRKIALEKHAAGEPELPLTPIRRWQQRFTGRQWESRARFLGWPLVSIQFSDPDRDFSGVVLTEKQKPRVAKGWIAFGDKAFGLLAFGNISVGGFAVGGVALGGIAVGGIVGGGIAFGGLTLGVLSLGGLALGFAAIGGCAAGWWASGGSAFGWKGAYGGYAVAREMALGGHASALHANDDLARGFAENHWFFALTREWVDAVGNGWFIGVLGAFTVFFVLLIYLLGWRRREDGNAEGGE